MMKIRGMGREDIAILHRIINEPEIIKSMPLPQPVPRKRVEGWYGLSKKTHDPEIFVIEDGDCVIGCVSLGKDGTVSMWIDADHQNQGFGSKAMEWVIARARKKRMKRLFVKCFLDNKRAIDFYEYAGFEKLQKNQGMLMMELEL